MEKYQNAYDNLNDLKEAINEYSKNPNRIIRRAMFAFFQDFSEYIVDMCESYIIINDGKIKSSSTSLNLIEQAYGLGFFDEDLKEYLIFSVKLRNRYTHDYYKREESEKQIEEFCFKELSNLDIFLEESKDKVLLKYIKNQFGYSKGEKPYIIEKLNKEVVNGRYNDNFSLYLIKFAIIDPNSLNKQNNTTNPYSFCV